MFRKQKPVEQPRNRQRVVTPATQNATVFSYHANRSTTDQRGRQMDQPEEKPRRARRRPRLLKPQNIVLITVVILTFIFLISLGGKPKIVMTGEDTSHIFTQDISQYQQTAATLFARSALNSNKLTVNTSAVISGLKATYPEIRTVTITLPVFGRQPVVYVQLAVPQMILATQHNGQFVLDSSGRALVPVSTRLALPSGNNALPVVIDQSGISLKAGQIALPQQSVAFVAEVNGQLKAKGLTATSWNMPGAASELDVMISGLPYAVRFNLQGDPKEQAGTFLATKNYLVSKGITPAQYVDVRVAGRAYYK